MNHIEIGIDLGTTNSEIAISSNGTVQIVKNTYGDEFTPSVFGVSKGGDEQVGKMPYARYFKDATESEIQNNKPEIKRIIGTDEKVYFPRLNKSYNAEEISGKILANLRADALRKNANINANAAVITYPMRFTTLQSEATKRAGNLAGFSHVVLLQEPIAAAISYGFGKKGNEKWLVYDLGGGTFDVAIIALNDGNLSVIGHDGDNFLGGKDIDNLIVDDFIMPILKEKHKLNLKRENSSDEARVAFAKLKYAAEHAKIELSSVDKTSVELDFIFDGKEIYENITITQKELEKIMSNLLDKTIECCKRAINGIKIDKIILVGGPTQLPFVKARLEAEFGVLVDNSSDPLTAVARGACIYAMGQQIPKEFLERKKIDENSYEIELNYESLTSETDEMITGQIPALKTSEDEYFVQIQSADNSFNTGKIKLKDGKFIANVAVAENRLNLYYLYLFDKDGNVLETNLNEFSITQGLSVSGAIIPHSVGVGVSRKDLSTGEFEQEFVKFFEKGSILPLEKTMLFKSIKTIRENDNLNALPISVYEGESLKPQHNIFVCELTLTGEMLGANLYENSDIEVTLKISPSREISLQAFIPALDKSFEIKRSTHAEEISAENVEQLEQILNDEVEKIDSQKLSHDEFKSLSNDIKDIKSSLKNAKFDEDAKRKANTKIKDLQTKLEKFSSKNDMQSLKDEYYENLKNTEDLLKNANNEDFEKQLNAIKKDAQRAIDKGDASLLKWANEQCKNLGFAICAADIRFWLEVLQDLESNPHIKQNQQAKKFLARGKEAYLNDDIDELRFCARELMNLLPQDEAAALKIAGISL